MEQVAPDAVGSTFMALDKSSHPHLHFECILATPSRLFLLLMLLRLSADGAGGA
jgi:hypothetical protein